MTSINAPVTIPSRPAAAPRLAWLYLTSRRTPTALIALAACGAALHLLLHWTPVTGGFATQLPLLVVGAAAAVVGATVRSPFDESERATGRRLPLLRLAVSLAMTGAAYGALAGGAANAHLAIGYTGLLRDLVGLVGITLLTARFGGGNLAWLGTLSYLLLAVTGVGLEWTTPWLWPARPALDTGGAICATLAFTGGLLAVTFRGTRETGRD
jgi:hypothetical protein